MVKKALKQTLNTRQKTIIRPIILSYHVFYLSLRPISSINIHYKIMKLIGNILWLVFGGFSAAIGYFTGSLAMFCTIVGIPIALQTFKIGMLCLLPFGAEVRSTHCPPGCIRIPLNILWIIFGGFWSWLNHIFCGLLLCITIIGIPFGKQHFKMAHLALAPFGKEVIWK